MFVLLMLCFVIGAARSGLLPLEKCKPDDTECLVKFSKMVYPKLIAGDPTFNTEVLDPMHLKEIEGKLDKMYYKFIDSTLIGLKDCNVDNVKLNLDKSKLYFDLICPHFTLSGNYETNGQLLLLPVEGQGTFTINSKEFRIGVDCELNKITGSDGKEHHSVKTFKLKMDPRGGVNYDFKNLFNGNKELSDKVRKFTNDNWRDVALYTQGPVINAVMKNIIKNANKFMKVVPAEEYLILN